MTVEEIKKSLGTSEYDFLRTDSHLGDRISIITLGGSYAYGTNIDDSATGGHVSDVDIRGMFLEKPDEIIGMVPNPETVRDDNTDTVLYSFNKLFNLLIDLNPNTCELLGVKKEHILFMDDVGQMMFDNQKLFLSQKCIKSFTGYSNQQLARLENAIARDRLTEERKMAHVKNSMQSSLDDFVSRFSVTEFGNADLHTGINSDGHHDIFIDVNYKNLPVSQFNSLMNVLTNVHRAYNKMNHRNNKKDEEHLDKHAMHLIRLFYMGIDILEQQKIITYREKEHDLFMSIRRGSFRLPDGSYSDAFFDLRNEMEKRFLYAQKHTELPVEPDIKMLNEFKMDVNKKIIWRQ